MLRYTYIDRLV
jgi:hypothetical protein